MSYRPRKCTTFPTHDTKFGDAEKGQIGVLHNMEKRLAVLVAKLPNWKNGAKAKHIRKDLNDNLKGANFNSNHIRYALDLLAREGVIGKRDHGEDATYYAYASTPRRWDAFRAQFRKRAGNY